MNRQTFAEYLHHKISSALAVRLALEGVKVKRKSGRKIDCDSFTASVVISYNGMRAKFNRGHGISFSL